MRQWLLVLLFLTINTSYSKTFEIMSYNVENLFDAKHDEGKNDWSFTPENLDGKKKACREINSKFRRNECFESNWTAEKVELKLNQIVDVITKERQSVPDFLALIEVENLEVVERLAKKLGMDHIEMTNSPDARGIDVALLYKNNVAVKKINKLEHNVPVDYATRNILEVEFLLDGKYPITFFVNHWPSLANPDSWRIKAAEVLSNRTKEILKSKPEMNVLAMGDFNTIDENNPHPFKTVLFKDQLFKDLSENISPAKKAQMPLGTYYYPPKEQWNMLDRFFYNEKLSDGKDLDLVPDSFEIYLPQFALNELNQKSGTDDEKNRKILLVPKRFSPEATSQEKMGFSDHFAIITKISYPDVSVKSVSPKGKKKK